MAIQTFYFLYKTTNLINNKIYIGKHKTKKLDDGYIGSGKYLKYALNKYGRKNFSFEILEFYEDEEKLNQAEKEIVTEEFCLRDDTYNLCVGGKGGFSYLNRTGKNWQHNNRVNSRNNIRKAKGVYGKKLAESEEFRNFISKKRREQSKIYYVNHIGNFTDKSHSEETKCKISESAKVTSKGNRNSQYGSMWITNGNESKKIKSVDLIPEGWYKGRKIKVLE